jgi:hypothetical protein
VAPEKFMAMLKVRLRVLNFRGVPDGYPGSLLGERAGADEEQTSGHNLDTEEQF